MRLAKTQLSLLIRSVWLAEPPHDTAHFLSIMYQESAC